MWPCCSPPRRLPAEACPEVAEVLKGGQALARDGSERTFGRNQKVGVGALVGTSYTAAKLIQLRKAHAVRTIDQDGIRARNIEAVFDNGGGNENVGFVADEFQHHFFER